MPHLDQVELTLLIGGYAQRRALGARAKATVSATVEHWQDYLPDYVTLPHPSWRTLHWEKKNPWFVNQLVPALQARLTRIFA
jgi:uracil-DNA glycosylase